jgi:hypothetical protein
MKKILFALMIVCLTLVASRAYAQLVGSGSVDIEVNSLDGYTFDVQPPSASLLDAFCTPVGVIGTVNITTTFTTNDPGTYTYTVYEDPVAPIPPEFSQTMLYTGGTPDFAPVPGLIQIIAAPSPLGDGTVVDGKPTILANFDSAVSKTAQTSGLHTWTIRVDVTKI